MSDLLPTRTSPSCTTLDEFNFVSMGDRDGRSRPASSAKTAGSSWGSTASPGAGMRTSTCCGSTIAAPPGPRAGADGGRGSRGADGGAAPRSCSTRTRSRPRTSIRRWGTRRWARRSTPPPVTRRSCSRSACSLARDLGVRRSPGLPARCTSGGWGGPRIAMPTRCRRGCSRRHRMTTSCCSSTRTCTRWASGAISATSCARRRQPAAPLPRHAIGAADHLPRALPAESAARS